MLMQRLQCWLLPTLIVLWTYLQLSVSLPIHDERTHVFTNMFNPSTTTSTITIQNYEKDVHSSNDKNDAQFAHKLVASPAGLLRPDKFQFYTYNDDGDMITRQMTAQEIQSLIAAGGADHVAMDRQEPQKADDVLTGGKKVMDVVQKVQNVLKSALDKPPTLMGSIPQIPEHANIEWSNILPSILSGEIDTLSSNNESDQLLYKLTTEKIQAGNSAIEYPLSHESLMNATKVILHDSTKNPVDIQTNMYAGFSNNMEHVVKPQQIIPTGVFTEKPMIPVPVITLTQQKLSTLQSTVTESPVFQILSVIPVEAAESGYKKNHTFSSMVNIVPVISLTTELSVQSEASNQTEQFVELPLSQVLENSTSSQSAILDKYSVNIINQSNTNLTDKMEQSIEPSSFKLSTTSSIEITTSSYSTKSKSNISTVASITETQPPIIYDEFNGITNMTDKISAPNTTYILIQNKNDTNPSENTLFIIDIMKESKVNKTQENKIISQTSTVETPSYASVSLKPEDYFLISSNIPSITFSKNKTVLHLPSMFNSDSGIESLTTPVSLQTGYLDKDSSTINGGSLSSATYTETHNHNSQITGTQSITSLDTLSTQLVDSFSNVMNQISGTGPSILSFPSTSSAALEISTMMDTNYDQRSNTSDSAKITSITNGYDTSTFHDTNEEENIERVVTSQIYATRKAPLHNITAHTIDYFTTQLPSTGIIANKESISVNTENNNISTDSRLTVATSTMSAIKSRPNIESVNTTISSFGSWTQPEKFDSLRNQNESSTTFEMATVTDTPSKMHVADVIMPLEEILPVSSIVDVFKTQSTVSSIDINESLNKPINENLDSSLGNLNWSYPVSVIDQVLNIAPLASSTPLLELISLPNDTSSFLASNLASGLIAGFTTSTIKGSSFEKVNMNQIAENASNLHRIHPSTLSNRVRFPESTERTNQVGTMEYNINNNQQKKQNITYTQVSMQEPLLSKTNSSCSVIANDNVLLYHTEKDSKPNCESNVPSNDNNLLTNEKHNNSTKQSLPFLSNQAEHVSNKLKDSSEISTIIAEVGAINTEQLTTIQPGFNVQLSNTNKTLLDIGNQHKEQESVDINTNVGLSQLPVKVGLINFPNSTRNETISIRTESTPTLDILTTEKGTFFTNVSLVSSENLDTNTTLIIPSTNNYTNQVYEAIKNVQNNKDSYIDNNHAISSSSLPSLSIQEQLNTNGSSIKIITQASNTSTTNKESFRPSLTNSTYYNSVNSTLNQNNKNLISQNVAHTTSIENTSTTDSTMKNISVKINEQLNKTDNKIPPLKQSFEDSPKPEMVLQFQSLPSNIPMPQVSKPAYSQKISEVSDTLKSDVNMDINSENKWTLISQQVPPIVTKPSKPPTKPSKPLRKPVNSDDTNNIRPPETMLYQQNMTHQSESVLPLDASQTVSGLDATVKHTSADIVNFAKLCNELAFNFWIATNKGLSTARSLALSPFGMTSLLAMIFLGARGPTSDQMNEVLGLDDVATFNPHLVFQNVTDAVSLARGQGIANAAFVRELFADKMKVRKLMPFYKEQAQQFYEGLVAEVNFATISDLVRRRTNLLIRKQTGGRIKDFVKTNTVPLRSPLAALSANVFQTDCNTTLTSSIGRDGELYFAVSPAVRQRKLVPVPATTWRLGVLAGYEPSIDATAVALGGNDKLVSTIFILPGQQGHAAPGDTLDRLEQRLVRGTFRDGTWNKLLKVLIPRNGLELQVPKFSHRSVVNATAALKRMGLDELFSGNADLKGINGIGHRLHLADVLQMNLFSTCGDENILIGRHHVETYPASPLRSIRQRIEDTDSFGVTKDDRSRRDIIRSSRKRYMDSFYADQLSMQQFHRGERQIVKPSEKPRLKLDRPFLYFVRHNPSGIILHMGRFNPRLLP